tara:strand:- start:228 stop:476 length:249 start_codon:yes stop_codon:yes gene_type:complete
METLINKTQALQIAHALMTGSKTIDDYGFSARKEAAIVLNDMLELDKVEKELQSGEPESVKSDALKKALMIADLERKNFKKL